MVKSIPDVSPFINNYTIDGNGVLFNITNFFTYKVIPGCTLACSFGDYCGKEYTGTSSDVEITRLNSPWEIKASNN